MSLTKIAVEGGDLLALAVKAFDGKHIMDMSEVDIDLALRTRTAIADDGESIAAVILARDRWHEAAIKWMRGYDAMNDVLTECAVEGSERAREAVERFRNERGVQDSSQT